MLDDWIPRHLARHFRQTHHQLHDVIVEAAGAQTRFDSADEPHGRPCDLLGTFQYDGVSAVEGGEKWGEEVVERVVPRYEGEDSPEGVVVDLNVSWRTD